MEAMRASVVDAGDGTVGSTRLDDGRRLGGELAVPARVPRKKPPSARGATRLETRRETGASRDTDARARYAPAARCLGGRAVRVCALAAGSLASRPPFPRRVMKHESRDETPDGVIKAAHENTQRPCRNLERLFLGFKPWAAAANENAHTACSDRTTYSPSRQASLPSTPSLPYPRIHVTTHIKMAAMTSTFLGSAVAVKAPVKVAAKKAVAPVASLDGLKKVRALRSRKNLSREAGFG